MASFFIPFLENEPQTFEVNGHRLLIVSSTREDLEDELEVLGAEEIRELPIEEDQDSTLADLALRTGGGVVMTPPGISLSAIVHELEQQLPWVH